MQLQSNAVHPFSSPHPARLIRKEWRLIVPDAQRVRRYGLCQVVRLIRVSLRLRVRRRGSRVWNALALIRPGVLQQLPLHPGGCAHAPTEVELAPISRDELFAVVLTDPASADDVDLWIQTVLLGEHLPSLMKHMLSQLQALLLPTPTGFRPAVSAPIGQAAARRPRSVRLPAA